MSSRHLLLVTTSYPSAGEGEAAAGAFVADFAAALATRVHVTVICPAITASDEWRHPHLLVRRFSVPRLPLSLLSPKNPADWPAILISLRNGNQAVANICTQNPPDHILALWALPSGDWARRTGIPYSVWALGSDIWSLGRIPLVRDRLRAVLRAAHQRYADGLLLASDVERISGLPCSFLASSRILPARPRIQRPNQAPLRFAFLGRWHPNKGIDLLLDALDQLDEPDWMHIEEVRINGGGPLETLVSERCKRLRERGRPVRDGGYLDRNAAAKLLHESDWLLLPSRIESIPVIFSDAMQARCAVAATPVGDLPELIKHHGTGIVAERCDAEAIAALLRQLTVIPAPVEACFSAAAAAFDIGAASQRFLEAAGLQG